MKCINIDTSYKEYSNSESFIFIKAVISGKFKEIDSSYKKLLSISNAMFYITDEVLLSSTIKLLKECNLITQEQNLVSSLKRLSKKTYYSKEDFNRISAFYYSLQLRYETIMRFNMEVFKNDSPELIVNCKNRDVCHNLDKIEKRAKTQSINYFVEINKESHSQKNGLKKMIVAMSEMDYNNHTTFFDKDIKYLNRLKKNIVKGNNLPESEKSKHLPKIKHPYYAQIGALFAQGLITKISEKGIGTTCYYEKRAFKNPNQLSKYIKEEILKTNKEVRQYINDTLKEKSGIKDFYNKKDLIENTFIYCKEKNITVTKEFQSKYDNLES